MRVSIKTRRSFGSGALWLGCWASKYIHETQGHDEITLKEDEDQLSHTDLVVD